MCNYADVMGPRPEPAQRGRGFWVAAAGSGSILGSLNGESGSLGAGANGTSFICPNAGATFSRRNARCCSMNLTSTYFECAVPADAGDPWRFGYSRNCVHDVGHTRRAAAGQAAE